MQSTGLEPIRRLFGKPSRADGGPAPVLLQGAPPLVFVHVRRTGASAVQDWIERHYRYDDVLHEATGWEDLQWIPPSLRSGKKFVRGHFGSYIATQYKPADGYRYVTLLRDPVERVLSHFWQAKQSAQNTRLGPIIRQKEFGLEQFLAHPVSRPLASNFQVRNFAFDLANPYREYKPLLIDVVFAGEIGAVELARAKARLEEMDVIGFTEDLPQFVADLSQRFGFYPDERLALAPRRRDLSAIGADVLEKIRQHNALDQELYEYARQLADQKRRRAAITFQGINRMTNPIDASQHALFQWSVKEPFFGTGWSDTQSAEVTQAPPHRWMVGGNDANLVLKVKKGTRYLLLIDVLRFVDESQAGSFSILADGEKLALSGPSRTSVAGPSGGLFMAQLEPRPTELTVLNFHMDALKTFAQVNPADKDATPRGLAIRTLTLVELDPQGRPVLPAVSPPAA